jgi:hypothetical protein
MHGFLPAEPGSFWQLAALACLLAMFLINKGLQGRIHFTKNDFSEISWKRGQDL